MTLAQAIAAVRKSHAQRIAVPGKWKVWRDERGVHSANTATNIAIRVME